MAMTLKDVSARAGVSVATASRAFQRPELVGTATRDKVLAAAEELGYAPNRSARALITGRAGVYGVIVPDLENPFFPAVLKGAQARAHQLGSQLLITDAGEVPEGELPLVHTLAAQVDGIVLCSSRMDEDSLRQAATMTPLSLVNRVSPALPGVFADPAEGIPAALRHLQRMGHRRIGYVGGPGTSRSDAVRRTVIERVCTGAGLEWTDIGSFPPSVDGGRRGAESVLLTDVTAVLVYNDVMALALMERLRSFGVGVPGDISVVGWDDIEFSALVTPGLSTVRVPRYDMGVAAIDLVHERGAPPTGAPATDLVLTAAAPPGAGRARIGLPTQFVPRGSTAKVAASE
ncbi:transcriptional regulator [Brachybacterium sp. P6-10-X1]|uniref:LacI family DNA-binding transcriptional regulator n=1 Tax=Brachybacterium sp. P6-10-X1 TaxID=1903186 RepID=UPI0009717F7A|nr:LacI family DNA-binding transcriptional regulator [Brachybacterium sp. P6-10-X1]APX34191.1 transcriptional regulator [Brachybacterium sp. P6-10-X1]